MNPIVANVSHHNWDLEKPLDFAAAKNAGLAAIMIKATEGATYQDPKFADNLAMVRQAGLLCGTYHFGTAADVDRQIDNFLTTIGDPKGLHLVLGFETNRLSPSNTMSKDQALAFLMKLQAKTGRKPTIYTGSHMFDVFGPNAAPAFAMYRVWWAQYGNTLRLHPTWRTCWLWQFTNGKNGPLPHKIDGLGHCDLNSFAGTVDELTTSWLS
jgi:lysozyme